MCFLSFRTDVKPSCILIYVYYLLVLTYTTTKRDHFALQLRDHYELSASNGFELVFGVQIPWTAHGLNRPRGLIMGQKLYKRSVLRQFGMQDAALLCTPTVEASFRGLDA